MRDRDATSYLEEFHCKVDAVDFAVRDLKVPGPSSASADDDGVIIRPKFLRIDVDAHMRIGHEGLGDGLVVNDTNCAMVPYHSFCCHEVKTTLDDCLVELHAA
jgi:hypothetical protein